MKAKHQRRNRRPPATGATAVAGSAGTKTLRVRHGLLGVMGVCLLLVACWFGVRWWSRSNTPVLEGNERVARHEGSVPVDSQSKSLEDGNREAVVNKINHGSDLLAQGKPAEAVQVLTEAMQLNPHNEDVRYNLGLAYTRLGKLDEAIQQYNEALRIFPNYVEAHNNLGNVLMRAGRTDEAISQFESAIKVMPDYASAHNNLGTALQRTGRTNEALLQFQQAAKIMPEYWEAHFNVATSCLQAGKLDEARTELETVLRLRPDFEPARAALAGKEWQRANGAGP